MVLSHRNHGNFSRKLTCFLNPNQKEKPKCQDFSEKYSRSKKKKHAFFFLAQSDLHLQNGASFRLVYGAAE